MARRAQADPSWARHDTEWRQPAQVVTNWAGADDVDPALLRHRVRGEWWELLERLGLCLIVSREYEHLLVAMSAKQGRPDVSFMAMPHPSGIAFDPARGVVHVASTRNPNQIFDLRPVERTVGRADISAAPPNGRFLVPSATRILPGSLYIHDLAVVGGRLHANAVGHNAIVRIEANGDWSRVWWPRAIETEGRPDFSRNYLQLNSIAAGRRLVDSVFSASGERMSSRRPGHRNYPVDRRGVLFSARTREPIVRGLTRPHSARRLDRVLWVANSGYGGLARVKGGGFETVAELPGWTRGLALHEGIGFVGTSRVIPRFRSYAPGLDVEHSTCGIYAVALDSGRVLGSIVWPRGNQIFAVEAVPDSFCDGFPFAGGRRSAEPIKRLFYTFDIRDEGEQP